MARSRPRPILTEADLYARYARLPVWARDEIRDLQRTVDAQSKRLTALTTRPISNTIANPHADERLGEQPFYLDQDEQVEFAFGPRFSSIRVQVQRDAYHGEYLSDMADRAANIELDASNTFRLKIRD